MHSFRKDKPSDEKIYITNVKYRHKFPVELFKEKIEISPKIKDLTARSQFKTMQTILAHPGYIVVHEGLYENITPEKLRELLSVPLSIAHAVRDVVFKNGVIPDTYDELTEVQKDFLSNNNGAMVLFFLGKLTHVYQSQSESECKLTEASIHANGITTASDPSVNETREARAIKWCKQAAKESGNNKILLLFGADHDFKKRIALLNDPNVVFNGEIIARDVCGELLMEIIARKARELLMQTMEEEKSGTTTSFRHARTYNGVPEKLQFIINDSSISKFLDKGLTTLDQLTQFYYHKPYVLTALRHFNFIDAVNNKLLAVAQIGGLTKSQVVSLLSREKGAALKAKVEEFLKLNQKQQNFYSSQRNVNMMFASAVLFNRMQRREVQTVHRPL